MRARSDNAGMLRFRSNHEARNVLNEEKRRLMTIAGLYKVGDLFGRFCVNDTTEFWWAAAGCANHAAIVGDDADLYAAYARVTADHLFGVVGLKLVEISAVKKTI